MDFTEISYLSYTSWDSSWRNQKQSSLESKYSHQLSLSCFSCQCTLSAWGCQRLFSRIFSIFYVVPFALFVCKLFYPTLSFLLHPDSQTPCWGDRCMKTGWHILWLSLSKTEWPLFPLNWFSILQRLSCSFLEGPLSPLHCLHKIASAVD